MAKRVFDFNVGLPMVAISHQDAYDEKGEGLKIIKPLKEQEKQFRELLANATIAKVKSLKEFPTDKPICLFVLQFFASEKLYEDKDVDNMAKSILDALEGIVYKKDHQVKILLVEKKVNDERIPIDFLYITGKIQSKKSFSNFAKQAGTEQAYRLYQEVKKEQQIRE